jgi:hypothetical protein
MSQTTEKRSRFSHLGGWVTELILVFVGGVPVTSQRLRPDPTDVPSSEPMRELRHRLMQFSI